MWSYNSVSAVRFYKLKKSLQAYLKVTVRLYASHKCIVSGSGTRPMPVFEDVARAPAIILRTSAIFHQFLVISKAS
jgi:hypothetical protein